MTVSLLLLTNTSFIIAAGIPHDASVQTHSAETTSMKIRLLINDKAVIATLDDNPSARDFFARLPITLTLKDYAGTEKIAYLDSPLAEKNAPPGFTPSTGDITYYAPWGNLALFYKEFGYAPGLIKLGSLDGSSELLKGPGNLMLRVEAID